MPAQFRCEALSTLSAAALVASSAFIASAQQDRQAPPVSAPAAAETQPPSSPSPEVTRWRQALVARLDRFKRYPAAAHGTAGVVTLAFTIDRTGKLVSSRVAKSSGSPVLDTAALAMVKRAAPFPAPPPEVSDADLALVVAIRFAVGE